jgi:hypothetical protein
MQERRYHATLAFWHFCYEHKISGMELANETGYSRTFVNDVRANPRRTVSQRFVDRVQQLYVLPVDACFFIPVAETVRRQSSDESFEGHAIASGCS